MKEKNLYIGRTTFSLDSILYLKANGNYTEIYLMEDKKHLSSYNLGLIELNLNNKKFLRISRSIIINLKTISHIADDFSHVRTIADEVIPVTRRRRNALKELDFKYKFEEVASLA